MADLLSSPPGLWNIDPETATWSRERRRRAVVYKEFERNMTEKEDSLVKRIDARCDAMELKLSKLRLVR